MSSKAGMGYTYNAQVSGCQGGSRTIPHAVSAAGANIYGYGGGPMSMMAVGVSVGLGEVAVGVAPDTVEVAAIQIVGKK